MEEIWKDIEEYEGFYQVSNLGKVRSLDRVINGFHTEKFHIKGRIIKPVKCKNGYYEVHLNKNGKRKVFLLHRVVAKAFLPNPNDFPEVNHKDEDISNNSLKNLEWCSSKYNANYGNRNIKNREGHLYQAKPIWQIDCATGKKIKQWRSIGEASKTLKIDDSQIIRVCKGRNKTAGGYIWEYC